MNSNYFQNPMFPGSQTPSGTPNQETAPTVNPPFPEEQSYIENIFRQNRGKVAKLFFSFPDSVEWRDKVFTGVIEKAGRDHLVISDPKTGMWYLLLMIYLDYVEFQEKIEFTAGIATIR
jgi:spore germination protein Q